MRTVEQLQATTRSLSLFPSSRSLLSAALSSGSPEELKTCIFWRKVSSQHHRSAEARPIHLRARCKRRHLHSSQIQSCEPTLRKRSLFGARTLEHHWPSVLFDIRLRAALRQLFRCGKFVAEMPVITTARTKRDHIAEASHIDSWRNSAP